MSEVFGMAPAPARTYVLFGMIGVMLLAMLLLFGWMAYASRTTWFEVSAEGLQIHSRVYGRTIPLQSVDAAQTRVVDLERSLELRPRVRTNGIGMPGYGAGWFRLRNGERALLFVTDRSRVVYVPTAAGYSVLLSTPDPAGLVDAIRRAADR